ncbi:ABC transporter ATP-binding protein [Ideonella sp. BN130291]|uniref:ABC transporter ATP-binding protein n=1 Tax=Ideonella sp. BN130291 TaxID=3112940 RepID=UPI002E25DCA3|nr:sn-glycerol-3-phosphate ABC transporter ATP-binding protein UgpC [Ideonella sp. BN130291]
MQGIEWVNVSKRFGATQVIPDFSLRIEPGEFVALLGPSGCGKSTLLRMLAGLEPVSAGSMRIGGREVTTLPPGQRGVAMVFQQYALYPHMSVRDNMAFGLRNIGMPADQIGQRVEAAAKMLELGSLLERRPAQLSGGQRQRVAIGRALVKQPSAFLLDEPMSNLDAALRTRTRVELARLHKQLRTTMLLVTHDQVEAMTLADRIVVMNQGRIEQVATPMEAYDRPATRFVAGFVGSPAMNFLPVQRQPDDGGGAVVQLPGGALLSTGVRLDASAADGWTLGVRPEALQVQAEGLLPGTVEVIERLGDRTLLHVQLPDGSLVVADGRAQPERAIGDTVRLGFARDKLHLFDAQGRAHRAS